MSHKLKSSSAISNTIAIINYKTTFMLVKKYAQCICHNQRCAQISLALAGGIFHQVDHYVASFYASNIISLNADCRPFKFAALALVSHGNAILLYMNSSHMQYDYKPHIHMQSAGDALIQRNAAFNSCFHFSAYSISVFIAVVAFVCPHSRFYS